MKKKLLMLFGIMLIIIIGSMMLINVVGTEKEDETSQSKEKIKVLTTFYPVYMIGLNVADGIGEIEVNSLTDLDTGCLHDYQLTTEDMKLIASADVLVMNGGGMEIFLEDITANYPNLTIIDSSQGITFLPNELSEHVGEDSHEDGDDENHVDGEEDSYDDEHSDHDHGEFNAHVWLDPSLYIKQIENVRDGLIDYLASDSNEKTGAEDISTSIRANSDLYIQQIEELDQELGQSLDSMIASKNQSGKEQKAVIFHDSFSYFADRVGLEVAFTVPLDSDTSLSAGEIAEVIDEVKKDQIQYLFTEQQFSDSIAKQIAAETGAKVYIIDTIVTGDGSKDSYLKAMEKNLSILKEVVE